MFGGACTNTEEKQSRIVAYNPNTDEWTEEGNLNQARAFVSVFPVDQDNFFLFGGQGSVNDEAHGTAECYRGQDNQLTCEDTSGDILDDELVPDKDLMAAKPAHLFSVPADYCSQIKVTESE